MFRLTRRRHQEPGRRPPKRVRSIRYVSASPHNDRVTRLRKLYAWPGNYRPIWVIAQYTGRSAETFRTWHKQGRIPSKTDPKTGDILVDVVAAFNLHEATPQRRRAKKARAA
jgi:hypothetical protein